MHTYLKNTEKKVVEYTKITFKNPLVSILLLYINACILPISKQNSTVQNLEVSKIFKRYYINNRQINQRWDQNLWKFLIVSLNNPAYFCQTKGALERTLVIFKNHFTVHPQSVEGLGTI